MNNFENENWELITRILTGEANQEEKRHFRQWLEEDPQRNAFFEELKTAWDDDPDKRSAHASYLFDLESGTSKLRNKIRSHEKKQRSIHLSESTSKNRNKFAWKVAASILVVIIALSVFGIEKFWSPPMTTYKTSNVEQRIITLPDGSHVRLNKNSSIQFPKGLQGKQRKITLQGEAFFEVRHDSTRPFIVNTGNAVIQDIGTSFNVKQEENGQLVVMVKEGVVSLRNKQGDKETTAILKKNELGKVTTNAGIRVQQIDIENYLSWISGQLVFKKMPLKQVASQLKNIYGIRSKFADEDLASLKLTAFTHKLNIDEVLDLIAFSLDLRYQKKGDTVTWMQEK